MRVDSAFAVILFCVALSGCMAQNPDTSRDLADDSDDADGSDVSQAEAPEDGEVPPATPDGDAPVAQPPPLDVAVHVRGMFPATARFDPANLRGGPGQNVTLSLTNADENAIGQHRWVLVDVPDAATGVLAPGQSQTIAFRLPAEAGRYTILCDRPSHAELGLTGTFVVAPE